MGWEVQVKRAGVLGGFTKATTAEVATMTAALRALEDGSFQTRAKDRREGGTVVSFTGDPTPDTIASVAGERVINSCVRGLVSEFISFIDRLLSVQRLLLNQWKLDIPSTVTDEKEAGALVDEQMEKGYLAVAAARGLQNGQKLRELGISGDTERIALSMLALRRALEHHGAVATKPLTVVLRHPGIMVDGKVVEQFPVVISEGSSFTPPQIVETTRHFQIGQPIHLSEADVATIEVTLRFLAGWIVQTTSARLTKGGA